MKIVVCIRQGLGGEINPFDACAYEAALGISGADITLLSMASEKSKDFLLSLTRLGAKDAVLLCDSAFAGSDTLATAYALSKAIEGIGPDLVFCGRQTLIGDTAQTPPMLAEMLGYSIITNVMEILSVKDGAIECTTRQLGKMSAQFPALITLERINTLRHPRLRSKVTGVTVKTAADIGADPKRLGLSGSPTRVISSTQKESGKRKCRFIDISELEGIIQASKKPLLETKEVSDSGAKLKKVICIGKAPLGFAKTVADNVEVIDFNVEDTLAQIIAGSDADAVLWGSDDKSKRLAATVAAKLSLGLCADCTALETDGEKLYMIRPALSGSVIAKIISTTRPAMATVRTGSDSGSDITLTVGYGAKDDIESIKAFADRIGASLGATRKVVDSGIMPYSNQVGLTGRTVSPPVYIAVGVSGAVHHIVGMERSGTVIAINPDKDAPIFEYADYGIIANADILNCQKTV